MSISAKREHGAVHLVAPDLITRPSRQILDNEEHVDVWRMRAAVAGHEAWRALEELGAVPQTLLEGWEIAVHLYGPWWASIELKSDPNWGEAFSRASLQLAEQTRAQMPGNFEELPGSTRFAEERGALEMRFGIVNAADVFVANFSGLQWAINFPGRWQSTPFPSPLRQRREHNDRIRHRKAFGDTVVDLGDGDVTWSATGSSLHTTATVTATVTAPASWWVTTSADEL